MQSSCYNDFAFHKLSLGLYDKGLIWIKVSLKAKTKNNSLRGLKVDSLQLTFVPTSKSRDTKTMTNIKNLAQTNVHIVP